MKRHIPGLSDNGNQEENIPEGIFLVKVLKTSYRYHPQKPFYTVRFLILEPPPQAGQEFTGRLYCSERALWKMNWFLRDFQYDPELLVVPRGCPGQEDSFAPSKAEFRSSPPRM